MCETYMLTYMDHILKALYSGIYDKQHIYGYIYVFSYTFHIWLFRMGSQLSLPHGTNKKLKCETKNKMMSIIGPVQSRKEILPNVIAATRFNKL